MPLSVAIVGPVPPPLHGQSVATGALVEALRADPGFSVRVVDTSKRSFAMGVFSVGRLLELVMPALRVRRLRDRCDVLYLGLSQSRIGNLRDLIFLWFWRRHPVVVHLHGGGIGKSLFARYPAVRRLNRAVYRRADPVRAIVLSSSLRANFDGVIASTHVDVVPNFFDPPLLVREREAVARQTAGGPLRVLYLSNMIPFKGYDRLLSACRRLPKEARASVQVTFAGAFDSSVEGEAFSRSVADLEHVTYVGPVAGTEKARLLHESHVFVLPTLHPLEGQPISILEAYAAGLVVVTTHVGGIRDVFRPQRNGVLLKRADPAEIAETLLSLANPDAASFRAEVARTNRSDAAANYAKDLHLFRMRAVLRACATASAVVGLEAANPIPGR